MTKSELIDSLRAVNEKIRARLDRWQSPRLGATAIRARDLSSLRQEILRTTNFLRNIPATEARDPEVLEEVSQYRAKLERLARILPVVQLGLQAHKGRLEAALRHLNTVKAWADASRRSL